VEAQADQLVMLAVRDGDVERISVLFDRHHRMLFNFFLRLTTNRGLSEDLVQEVFFRMLKYRHTFQLDHPRGALRSIPPRPTFAGRTGTDATGTD